MELSIIILTLNNKHLLEQCIDSVLRYTKSITFEIIIVDNNSSDGTQELIRSKYPKATLIANEKNLGFTRANNKGLRTSKGRYALLLNDDTYLKDDAFSKMLAFMDSRPDVGICGPRLLNTDGSIQRQGSILSSHTWKAASPVETQMVIGACMLIRASMTEKLGLLDENLFFYNDDLDYCKRARSAGYKVVYYPLAQIFHIGGYTMKKSFNSLLFVEGFRGGLYFCKKHYGVLPYSIYSILLFFYTLLMLPFSLPNSPKWKAYIKVLWIIISQHIIPNA